VEAGGAESDDTPLKVFQQRVAKLREAPHRRVFGPTWSEDVVHKNAVSDKPEGDTCAVPAKYPPSETDSEDEYFDTGGYNIKNPAKINQRYR